MLATVALVIASAAVAYGPSSPLVSVDVYDRTDGTALAVYWKNGAERMDRPGVQGGTIPIKIGPQAVTDPYGHANDEYQAEESFADYLTAAMGQLMRRFEGSRKHFRKRRNGGTSPTSRSGGTGCAR